MPIVMRLPTSLDLAILKSPAEGGGCPAVVDRSVVAKADLFNKGQSRTLADFCPRSRFSRVTRSIAAFTPQVCPLVMRRLQDSKEYRRFAKYHAGITLAGCWPHAHRGFHKALEEAPRRALGAPSDPAPLAGLGARRAGARKVQELRPRFCPPSKYPTRSLGSGGIFSALQPERMDLWPCTPTATAFRAAIGDVLVWTPSRTKLRNSRTMAGSEPPWEPSSGLSL